MAASRTWTLKDELLFIEQLGMMNENSIAEDVIKRLDNYLDGTRKRSHPEEIVSNMDVIVKKVLRRIKQIRRGREWLAILRQEESCAFDCFWRTIGMVRKCLSVLSRCFLPQGSSTEGAWRVLQVSPMHSIWATPKDMTRCCIPWWSVIDFFSVATKLPSLLVIFGLQCLKRHALVLRVLFFGLGNELSVDDRTLLFGMQGWWHLCGEQLRTCFLSVVGRSAQQEIARQTRRRLRRCRTSWSSIRTTEYQ